MGPVKRPTRFASLRDGPPLTVEPGCAGSSTHGVRTSERYGAWAARWASRFVHEAPGAELDEAALVLSALIALRGRARLAAARALEELCELGGQQRSAAVLERWLVDRAL